MGNGALRDPPNTRPPNVYVIERWKPQRKRPRGLSTPTPIRSRWIPTDIHAPSLPKARPMLEKIRAEDIYNSYRISRYKRAGD